MKMQRLVVATWTWTRTWTNHFVSPCLLYPVFYGPYSLMNSCLFVQADLILACSQALAHTHFPNTVTIKSFLSLIQLQLISLDHLIALFALFLAYRILLS